VKASYAADTNGETAMFRAKVVIGGNGSQEINCPFLE
ncbi:hypothetical protein AVEN_255462-1, partial [Araneus ventricosus]